jgi:PAS domain-containing protein
MKQICAWCGANLAETGDAGENRSPITHGICPACARKLMGHEQLSMSEFLETLDAPVVVTDRDGVVLNANRNARDLLNIELEFVRGKRGGDVIECELSRSPGGCGSTEHCQSGCVIRRSVNHTFDTGEGLQHQLAQQMLITASGVRETRLVISTEKVGELIMLRIDKFDGSDPSA